MHRLLEEANGLMMEGLTMLEAISEAADRLGLEPKAAARIVKRNKEQFAKLEEECLGRRLVETK